MLTKYDKYRLIYSPRTSMSNMREREEKLFSDLGIGFEPGTIEIIKKHLKERLGVIDKITFISIIKCHLDKWHPELANREEILIKLLSRLFDQIDLNSNGDLEWSEFMNYIVENSFRKNFQKASNTLQEYAICRNNNFSVLNSAERDEQEKHNLLANVNQSVSYCFYIQKYKLLGVVNEFKSSIVFYNVITNKKEGKEINLVQTQEEIDKFEINELDHKTKIKLEKESEKLRNLMLKKQQEFININNRNLNRNKLNENLTSFKTQDNLNSKNKNKIPEINKTSTKNRVPTPLSIAREIRLIKGSNFFNNKNLYKFRKLHTLCVHFIEKYDLLFISSNNNKISAWQFDKELNSFKNVNSSNFASNEFIFSEKMMNIPIFSCSLPQYTLCFDLVTNRLYSGQEDGKILVFNMNSSKPKHYLVFEDNKKKKIQKSKENKFNDNIMNNMTNSNKNNNKMLLLKEQGIINENSKKQNYGENHLRDSVSCLLILNKLRLLCSSYHNGKIIFWDVATRLPKKIIDEQKTSIYQFVFDPHKNYLYTCGFDHNIYVYDPYNEESSIYQLKGHNSSVKSLSLNLENNELISIDINGNLKIWDTTVLLNFQTLNIYNSLISDQNHPKKQSEQFINKNKGMSNINVLYLSHFKKIIVYGDKFLIYEKGKTKNPSLCDDNLILGCIYNNFQDDLITFSSKRVKLWDIYTGKVKIIFEDPMEGGEITSFAHDREMKRFYIGDNYGKIKNFNLSTGGYLKSFLPHNTEIINLIHSSEFALLISCSSDLVIKFQSDSELATTELIKEINLNFLFSSIPGKDNVYIRDVKFNEEDSELIIGLSNIWISFYDVKHYKFSELLNMHQEAISKKTSISCMIDLKKIELLFIAYENGKKCFLTKPKNKYFYLLSMTKLGNFSENEKYFNENDEYKGIGVCATLDEEENNLLVGDHLGLIHIYNLNVLNKFMNKKFDNDEQIKDFALNSLNIKCCLCIKAHIESIKFISIPKDLKPKIILSTGNDRNVKLINYQTGEYIDSLKQISIKYNPIPIAIEYIKNNPFLEDIKEIEKKTNMELFDTENILKLYQNKNNLQSSNENNINEILEFTKYPEPEICTIYRNNAVKKNLKIPEFNYEFLPSRNAFLISNDILEYNAKLKLYNASFRTNVQPNRSTFWNYDIDIDFILNKKKEDINELKNLVKIKEKEIIETEIAYKTSNIFSPDYQPIFIKNLDEQQKEDLTGIINEKIKNIKFAISRSQISKCENESLQSLYNYNRNYDTPKSPKRKNNVNFNLANSSNKKKNKKKILSHDKNNNININIKNKFSKTVNEFKKPKKIMKNSKEKKENNIPLKTVSGSKNNKWRLTKYNDQRIERCLEQFKEKLFELQKPFELLYNNRNIKKNTLPKINQKIFTSCDSVI